MLLLYVHGFRSTINSAKAKLLKDYYGNNIIIADFSHIPKIAIFQLEKMIEKNNITGIIASSLGGFYATHLSEKYNLKCVLINPSTRPFETLSKFIGANKTYDGELFEWKPEYLDQLSQYAIDKPNTSNYQVFLQRGDEVLDYRIAKRYYDGADITIEDGGNHRFDGFERHFDKVDNFLDK